MLIDFLEKKTVKKMKDGCKIGLFRLFKKNSIANDKDHVTQVNKCKNAFFKLKMPIFAIIRCCFMQMI